MHPEIMLIYHRLVVEEYEAEALSDIPRLVGDGEMPSLMVECGVGIQNPSIHTARVKTDLSIDRDIDAEIVLATEEYNIAVCRTLAKGAFEKLPRELRDMVCHHLIPPTVELIHFNPPLLWNDYKSEENEPYVPVNPPTVEDTLCPEKYWRVEAIGKEMARELVQRFYGTTMFQILPTDLRSGIV
jgi:hypothetical protein